eukprot:1679130-Prymnesium_polylepis.1
MQQLVVLLAEEMRNSTDSPPLVPLVVYVQKLAKLWSPNQGSNLILEYIRAEITDPQWVDVLQQAFEMRTLVILMDGIDEAAALKEVIEEFVLQVLVPLKMRTVVTSRPEGIRRQ